jgi:hypothetical protein
MTRSRRRERDSTNLCAFSARRTEGCIVDVGGSCDKHRDKRGNDGGNEIGSAADEVLVKAPFSCARPKGFEPPTF